MTAMKIITILFVASILLMMLTVTWFCWASEDFLTLGNFVVLSLTLIVLAWYAYDTNSIARITRERWLRDGVLRTTYEMQVIDQKGNNGHTIFRLHNPSTLVVRATVACNFKIYGEPTTGGPAYNGTDVWLLFPQQVSQGWFEIQDVLQTKGKNIEAIMAERTIKNSASQLTMMLELEFWDELGARRKLPARSHYFEFDQWAWIPQLTMNSKT